MRASSLRLLLVVLLASACSYQAQPPSGHQECAPAGSKRCPDGYQCVPVGTRELCWKNGESPPVPQTLADGGDQPEVGGSPDLGPSGIDVASSDAMDLAIATADAAEDGSGGDVPANADLPNDAPAASREVGPPDVQVAPELVPDLARDQGPAAPSCSGGYQDCDGNPDNGCEVNLQGDPRNCGKCGMVCPLGASGLAAVCSAGTCGMATCSPPLMNCDTTAANGCETDTSSAVSHCGACGVACSNPMNGTAGCAQGKCRVASCLGAFRDCNDQFSDGCEVDSATDLNHCRACGNVCPTRLNSTPTCTPAGCDLTCTAPFDNCDGDQVNGCETDVRSNVRHCGACSWSCNNPPQGVASCSNRTCVVSCTAPFLNCDTQFANGCEVNSSTSASNCGVCGNVCSIPDPSVTTVSCVSGLCKATTCNTPRADCDGVLVNGCEVDTSTNLSHCGACKNVCGAGFVCEGECKWTPKALTDRLSLWLDASVAASVIVTNGRVSQWNDLSGRDNHAAQALDTRRPVLQANAFGSRFGLRFNPTDDLNEFLLIPDADSLNVGAGEFTVLAVAKGMANSEPYSVIFTKQNRNVPPFVGPSLWLNRPNAPAKNDALNFQVGFRGDGNVETGPGFGNNTTFILTGRRINGGTIEVRANNAKFTALMWNPSEDLSAPGHAASIAAHGVGDGQNFNGWIAEIILIKGSVTEAELTSLEKYMEGKYPGVSF